MEKQNKTKQKHIALLLDEGPVTEQTAISSNWADCY